MYGKAEDNGEVFFASYAQSQMIYVDYKIIAELQS